MNSTCGSSCSIDHLVWGHGWEPPSTTLGTQKKGRRANGVGKNGGLKEGVGSMEESKMENEKETKAMGNNQKKEE